MKPESIPLFLEKNTEKNLKIYIKNIKETYRLQSFISRS